MPSISHNIGNFAHIPSGYCGYFSAGSSLGRVPDTHFVCLRNAIGGETPEAPVFWPFSLDTQAKARQFSNLYVTVVRFRMRVLKAKSRQNSWRYSLLLGASLVFVSCQTDRHLVLEAVGPPSRTPMSRLDLAGIGFLKVYSATETREVGKAFNYYPHTPYLIYHTNGMVYRWVANSASFTDESPALVRLPAGVYTVRAQDDNFGRVYVPVVIQGGETTVIYLEIRALPRNERLSVEMTNAVRLPDGRLAGWRAEVVGASTP